jgi:hypothetical protein
MATITASPDVFRACIMRAEEQAAYSETLIVVDPAHRDTWCQRYSDYANEAAGLRQALFNEHALLYRDGALVTPTGASRKGE